VLASDGSAENDEMLSLGRTTITHGGEMPNCLHLKTTTTMLVTISFPSPTRSYIPGLKPSFSANPSHRSLSFSSSGWIPQTFTATSEHIRFYF